MSTTVMAATVIADGGPTLSTGAQTFALDLCLLCQCTTTSKTGLINAATATLYLSSDGVTYVPAASKQFKFSGTKAFESFSLADYGYRSFSSNLSLLNGITGKPFGAPQTTFSPPWTNYLVTFSGNAGAAVTITVTGDSGALSTPTPALFTTLMNTALPPGASGTVLTSTGTSGVPTYQSAVGSGTVTEIDTGAGIGGGPITTTGTIALLPTANNQPTVITPTLAAATNDWSPTGWLVATLQSANVIRVNVTSTTPATSLLTGLVPPATAEGCVVTIQNLSTSVNALHFVASSASSSAANRFAFLSDVWIDPGDSIQLIYDGTLTEWREYCPHKDFSGQLWGSGYDGVGPTTGTTFTRDMFFTDWVIPASQVFITAGFNIFVAGTLDLSNATLGSIIWNGNAGTAGTTGGAGGAGGTVANGLQGTLGFQSAGGAGGAGSANNGTLGTASTARVVYNTNGGAGGGGAAGNGGTGTGAGFVAGTGITGTASFPLGVGIGLNYNLNGASNIVFAGQGGSGGSGGGGDTVGVGGGGGGGGCCGGYGVIRARKICMGSNATAAIIQYKGGVGGAGGAGGATGSGNTGGGGGGGGGAGGVALIIHGGRFGTGGTAAVDVTGGNGGAGGALHGTGVIGNGGNSGPSGSYLVYDVRIPLASANWALGTAAVAHSGSTGGIALVTQANI